MGGGRQILPIGKIFPEGVGKSYPSNRGNTGNSCLPAGCVPSRVGKICRAYFAHRQELLGKDCLPVSRHEKAPRLRVGLFRCPGLAYFLRGFAGAAGAAGGSPLLPLPLALRALGVFTAGVGAGAASCSNPSLIARSAI